jgi:hypothetical protein
MMEPDLWSGLTQSEERQNGDDDHDGADQPNKIVHFSLLSSSFARDLNVRAAGRFLCCPPSSPRPKSLGMLSNGPFPMSWRSRLEDSLHLHHHGVQPEFRRSGG